MKHTYVFTLSAAVAASLLACSDDAKSDADFKAEVVAAMHDSIGADLANLVQAAKDLQAAAPTHQWDNTADATAIAAMKDAWKRTRVAYEHVEGATAPIFGDLDFTMDARYDDQLIPLIPEGDQDLFDDQGVTGMHAIERILYAPGIRDTVLDFEEPLPGYKAADYPTNETEALAFKTKLAQKLIDDAQSLLDNWQPNMIDVAFAFQGLVGLMNEQGEKVDLAATGEEESRYADLTMFDLRNNLEGTTKIYGLFRAWIQSKPALVDADTKVVARLDALKALYTQTTSDSIPAVPESWSADQPTTADLATPFGTLWSSVRADVDPDTNTSIVFQMHLIADALGFPELPE